MWCEACDNILPRCGTLLTNLPNFCVSVFLVTLTASSHFLNFARNVSILRSDSLCLDKNGYIQSKFSQIWRENDKQIGKIPDILQLFLSISCLSKVTRFRNHRKGLYPETYSSWRCDQR